jgi:hypothetical protein
MKTAFQILLTIAILVLAYFCIDSINKPVKFQKNYETRRDKVIERLKEIRSAQVAYRSVNGVYTASFDTLIAFVAADSLPMVRMEGALTDSMLFEGMTEATALKMGIITRDTSRISVRDSLFSRKPWILDSLRYVPFTDQKEFEMGIGIIKTASQVEVPVFEARVHNNIYLNGLEEQEIININDRQRKLEKYPGLKVGSLSEANNNAGNWE